MKYKDSVGAHRDAPKFFEDNMFHLYDLPEDIIDKIFSELPPKDLYKLTQGDILIDKKIYRIVDPQKHLFKKRGKSACEFQAEFIKSGTINTKDTSDWQQLILDAMKDPAGDLAHKMLCMRFLNQLNGQSEDFSHLAHIIMRLSYTAPLKYNIAQIVGASYSPALLNEYWLSLTTSIMSLINDFHIDHTDNRFWRFHAIAPHRSPAEVNAFFNDILKILSGIDFRVHTFAEMATRLTRSAHVRNREIRAACSVIQALVSFCDSAMSESLIQSLQPYLNHEDFFLNGAANATCILLRLKQRPITGLIAEAENYLSQKQATSVIEPLQKLLISNDAHTAREAMDALCALIPRCEPGAAVNILKFLLKKPSGVDRELSLELTFRMIPFLREEDCLDLINNNLVFSQEHFRNLYSITLEEGLIDSAVTVVSVESPKFEEGLIGYALSIIMPAIAQQDATLKASGQYQGHKNPLAPQRFSF